MKRNKISALIGQRSQDGIVGGGGIVTAKYVALLVVIGRGGRGRAE